MRLSGGLTLFELLVVMALATTLGFSLYGSWRHEPALSASAMAMMLRSMRWQAVTGGTTIGAIGDCAAHATLLGPYRAVHVVPPERGLQFAPDGLPRTCDNGGVGNATILLEHRGRWAAVIVSSLGRTRWEPR